MDLAVEHSAGPLHPRGYLACGTRVYSSPALTGTFPLLPDPDQVGGDVEGITAWESAQPGWWVEFWNTAGHLDPPVGMVDESMVATAQRNAVRDAGRAFVGPMYDMVNFAPTGWYSASWESTPAIP